MSDKPEKHIHITTIADKKTIEEKRKLITEAFVKTLEAIPDFEMASCLGQVNGIGLHRIVVDFCPVGWEPPTNTETGKKPPG